MKLLPFHREPAWRRVVRQATHGKVAGRVAAGAATGSAVVLLAAASAATSALRRRQESR